MHTLGYDLTINFLVSSMIKIPRANPKGIPQNLEGIGVVEKVPVCHVRTSLQPQ